ncbi:hypothetical protein [Serratia proteamaculans]
MDVTTSPDVGWPVSL